MLSYLTKPENLKESVKGREGSEHELQHFQNEAKVAEIIW